MRAQVSAELLVIVGFIALVMAPVLFSVYVRGSESAERISISQVNIAATRLANAVDSVGRLGGNAKLVLEVQIPSKLLAASAEGREMQFSFGSAGRRNDIVKRTGFEMSQTGFGKLSSPGTYFVEVGAKAGGIVGVDVR